MYNPGALLMPSWRHYGWALYMFQMSWHCAPLKSEGAFSLSGNPMRGKPHSVSNQKGSSSCLQSENCWSQSPICRPVQITVDWPINRLSSRDGTYHSVMQWSQHPYQISSITSTIPSQFSFTSQTHSIPQSQPLILSHTIHFSIPLSKYQIYI